MPAEGADSLRSAASHELADSKERVVRALLAALEARDIGAISELLTDDVVYHFPGRGPVAGTYQGRDAVLGLERESELHQCSLVKR